MPFMLNETISRVMLFQSAPYILAAPSSEVTNTTILYLSALAANNKMDLVTKAAVFPVTVFIFLFYVWGEKKKN